MKRIENVPFLHSCPAYFVAQNIMGNQLKIGWAQTNITPAKPAKLRGQFYQRISTYVQSELIASAIAIQTDRANTVLCAVDTAGISSDLIRRVRENVCSQVSDLSVEHIIIAATHTHTAPSYRMLENQSVFGLHVANEFLPKTRRAYAEPVPAGVLDEYEYGIFLAHKIAEAIITAWRNRMPAAIGRGFARAVTGHCRRVTYNDGSAKMYGATDTQAFDSLEGSSDSGIEFFYTFDRSRHVTGVVINVACPSQVVEHESFISADFWDCVRKRFTHEYGKYFHVMGLCAAAGDQSPRDQIRKGKDVDEPSMHDHSGMEEIGDRIFEAVHRKYEQVKKVCKSDVEHAHLIENMAFPIRKVTDEQVKTAKEAIDAYVSASQKERFDTADLSALHGHGGILKRSLLQQDMKTYDAEVHVVKIGDMAIATNPFELFLDYGLAIKARSGFAQTMVVQLVNDAGGYLPTYKAEQGGHYSAVVASGRTGHQGGALLVQKTLDLLQSVMQE